MAEFESVISNSRSPKKLACLVVDLIESSWTVGVQPKLISDSNYSFRVSTGAVVGCSIFHNGGAVWTETFVVGDEALEPIGRFAGIDDRYRETALVYDPLLFVAPMVRQRIATHVEPPTEDARRRIKKIEEIGATPLIDAIDLMADFPSPGSDRCYSSRELHETVTQNQTWIDHNFWELLDVCMTDASSVGR
jgi:hypothetical protein